MPIPREFSEEVIERITGKKSIDELIARLQPVPVADKPLPPRLPREASWSREDQEGRLKILEEEGIRFEYLNGRRQLEDPSSLQGNIENFVGMAQVPVGVVGPLRVNGLSAKGDFYVPMATTEGVLVASHNRGARVVSLSGGATVMCLTERVSRAPGFLFRNLVEAGKFVLWCTKQYEVFKSIVKGTSRYAELEDVRTTLEGNHVYLSFEYTTGDASGQNMVTIATEAVCQHIIKSSPIQPKHWFIESNMSGDKKATAMSFIFVRGKKVTAEALIPRSLCVRMLHATPEKIMEYAKLSVVGAVQAGSIGVQGHYANGLAAIFIACGQDAACVSEASVGITRVDIVENGDLYISVTLPNLIVGTVGGGTGLPTQAECLEMMGCRGEGNARKFAEICTAFLLSGELSIMGGLSSGEFAAAHIEYARKKRSPGIERTG
jgi:hydroxymethylglutaryl-CoA reductase (NADPH)